ncbi:MAG: ACP S-malonyltransferase [Mycobacterium sp.]|nr:ACP S-malonyltransferase [Mycobacterium sp.]
MIAFLAPGQGSQTPGMLAEWLELPGAADRISLWSQVSGLDLATLGTTATAEEITDTAVTQPLVVATTLLAFGELAKRGLPTTTLVAGHSVGEIAAYAIAGVISGDDAVKLAAVRGAEMAKACAVEPTGMSAVLGGDEAEVLARLDALELIPANRNAAGQIVAAGSVAALEKLAEDPPDKARVRQLATAGAFHTHYMASALDGYAAAAAEISVSDPTMTLLSNCDGRPVTSGSDALAKLVAQLTRPVRWDLCTETMRNLTTTAIVEFPPAGALTGIAKRELRGVATHAVKTPADLDGLTGL